jgi:hypothetical protein
VSTYGKRKGSQFETDVLRWFRGRLPKAITERLARAGANDEGDLVLIVAGKPYVFELKATAKMDLPQFWREATVEAQNYAKARGLEDVPPSYVIVKRRMAGIDQAWVVQTLEQWAKIHD